MFITESCTGCRACEQLCPRNCISMQADAEGFLVAEIDKSACISCGLCEKKCPQNRPPSKMKVKSTFAVRYRQDDELKKSASGGAFVALANAVLERNGVVFGVTYLEDWSVAHILIDSKNSLYKLQGSKYVQSDTLYTYGEAKEILQKDLPVLYSGTPCQIAGLRNFLGREYDNLITIDLICHGVPSPKLFKKYISWLELKEKSKVLLCDFRDKTEGWGLLIKIETTKKTKRITGLLDPYYYHFLQGNTYRECCYKCKYCTPQRISDMTIGDYWGIQKEHPSFFSTKGVSVILLNTEKAVFFFDTHKDRFHVQQSSFDQAANWNHNLISPTLRKEIRDTIYHNIDQKEVNVFFRENMHFKIPLKRKIMRILPSWAKLFIKRLV